jgi:hypothetical protein
MRDLGDDPAGGKGAIRIEIAVKTDNLMARFDQHRHHDSSDVTQMPSDQHAHDFALQLDQPLGHPTLRGTFGAGVVLPSRQGILPCSTMSSSTSLSFKVSIGRQKPSCFNASS